MNDIKRRFPMYASDITDGLNSETIAATLFLYFAGLATAITFGGLIGEKTLSLIGISETLLSSCVVGMIFHAFASQPLVFVGTTGPLILIDESLYQFCDSNSLNFLTVRVYVGIWLTIIVLTISAFEGSVYVRFFTRFTQEIFSALITLIYIIETILTVVKNFQRHPLNFNSEANFAVLARSSDEVSSDKHGPINQPNTAFFSMLLTLGTFCTAYGLKVFRNSKFLGRNTRRALGDFVSYFWWPSRVFLITFFIFALGRSHSNCHICCCRLFCSTSLHWKTQRSWWNFTERSKTQKLANSTSSSTLLAPHYINHSGHAGFYSYLHGNWDFWVDCW